MPAGILERPALFLRIQGKGVPMSSILETQLTPMSPTADGKPLLSLTDAAIEKVKFFATTMPDSQNKPLRIFVQGGGCSGFQYGFQFDEKRDGDNVIDQGGITVIVDPQSATYLKDAKVNYVEDFRGAGFAVENPNATGGSCGCGKSFNA
jgi:iron-sulfur cluster insertion protein